MSDGSEEKRGTAVPDRGGVGRWPASDGGAVNISFFVVLSEFVCVKRRGECETSRREPDAAAYLLHPTEQPGITPYIYIIILSYTKVDSTYNVVSISLYRCSSVYNKKAYNSVIR